MLRHLLLLALIPEVAPLLWGGLHRLRPQLVTTRARSGNGGFISEDTISEVLAVAKLSDVAARHVAVKRNGRTVTACCPFHDDSRPSMAIDDSKNLYHCFACGEGGNLFKFVEQIEGVGFAEAVEILADTYSVPVVYKDASFDGSNAGMRREAAAEARARKVAATKALEAAADWFARQLGDAASGGGARSVLRARRTAPAAALEWGLGWAPDSSRSSPPNKRGAQPNNHHLRPSSSRSGASSSGSSSVSLTEHLRGLGFETVALVEAGLVAPSKYPPRRAFGGAKMAGGASCLPAGPGAPHGYFEVFRGRLMVPVRDATSGAVVGFGARRIDDSDSTATTATATAAAVHSNKNKNNREGEHSPSISSGSGGPKYLNSPETALFRKSKLLFGLHEAKAAARSASGSAKSKLGAAGSGLCLVVEGYFDVISLHSSGVTCAVGCLGTALTADQLSLAARVLCRSNAASASTGSSSVGHHGPALVLALDGDEAGQKALERLCIDLLPSLVGDTTGPLGGVEVRVGGMPSGCKDPADALLMNKGDPSVFLQSAVIDALPWPEWYAQRVLAITAPPPPTSGAAAAVPSANTFSQRVALLTELIARLGGLPTSSTPSAAAPAGSSTSSSSSSSMDARGAPERTFYCFRFAQLLAEADARERYASSCASSSSSSSPPVANLAFQQQLEQDLHAAASQRRRQLLLAARANAQANARRLAATTSSPPPQTPTSTPLQQELLRPRQPATQPAAAVAGPRKIRQQQLPPRPQQPTPPLPSLSRAPLQPPQQNRGSVTVPGPSIEGDFTGYF